MTDIFQLFYSLSIISFLFVHRLVYMPLVSVTVLLQTGYLGLIPRMYLGLQVNCLSWLHAFPVRLPAYLLFLSAYPAYLLPFYLKIYIKICEWLQFDYTLLSSLTRSSHWDRQCCHQDDSRHMGGSPDSSWSCFFGWQGISWWRPHHGQSSSGVGFVLSTSCTCTQPHWG